MELRETIRKFAQDAPGFTGERVLTELRTPEQFDAASASFGLDYRSLKNAARNIRSVFDGLEFDPLNVRSQAFFITEGREHIGLITFIIVPQGWIEQQRYLRIQADGVRLCGAAEAFNIEACPSYFIIPGWAKVARPHLTRSAFSALRFYQSVLLHTIRAAPKNTWMECVAKGRFKRRDLWLLRDLPQDSFVRKEELPFTLEAVGAVKRSSSATIKLARRLGLPRIEGVGHCPSLGPVFAKRVDGDPHALRDIFAK